MWNVRGGGAALDCYQTRKFIFIINAIKFNITERCFLPQATVTERRLQSGQAPDCPVSYSIDCFHLSSKPLLDGSWILGVTWWHIAITTTATHASNFNIFYRWEESAAYFEILERKIARQPILDSNISSKDGKRCIDNLTIWNGRGGWKTVQSTPSSQIWFPLQCCHNIIENIWVKPYSECISFFKKMTWFLTSHMLHTRYNYPFRMHYRWCFQQMGARCAVRETWAA